MAGREELVDAIAGFALFADLTAPQLEGIVHTFDEAVFGEGERILRQGISGSGFHVILDGEAAIVVDGTERARLGRGDFFGEVSILLGETPIADVVATRPMRCLVLAGVVDGGVPHRPSAGHVPDAPGAGPPAAGREPMAELTRPFPPGSYPVIVIGSGPGGLQVSYSLRAQGVPHAVLSADPAPGGMFRRWPFFQRLLSWTKPYAPVARGTRAYERYDWNSLLGRGGGDPGDRADADGRHLVLPVAAGDGGEPGRVRGPGRARGPLRLRLDGDPAARRTRRARTASRSRPSTAATPAAR